jgi:serine/threonine-protein kinase RsbT
MGIRITDEERIELIVGTDKVLAVSAALRMAAQSGFEKTEQHLIATAVSELATNVVRYGGGGEMVLRTLHRVGREGFEVVALDSGPGIRDIDAALKDNFSTGDSLGMGLPGIKRIMDEFSIDSTPGKGTRCVARKWR